jgi:hypothetical protein
MVPGRSGDVKGTRRTGRQEENVGQRGKNINQRIPREKWIVPLLYEEVGPGPPARDEVPLLVGVAAAFAAHVEVELCAGLSRRLAEVTAAARARLRRGAHAAVGGVDSGGPDGVVEELLAKVALRLGGLVAISHLTNRRDGQGNFGIRRRNLQLIDSTNLLVDEVPQPFGAVVVLSDGDCAKQQESG